MDFSVAFVAVIALVLVVVIGVVVGKHSYGRGRQPRSEPKTRDGRSFWRRHEGWQGVAAVAGFLIVAVLVGELARAQPDTVGLLLLVAIGVAVYYRSEKNRLRDESYALGREQYELSRKLALAEEGLASERGKFPRALDAEYVGSMLAQLGSLEQRYRALPSYRATGVDDRCTQMRRQLRALARWQTLREDMAWECDPIEGDLQEVSDELDRLLDESPADYNDYDGPEMVAATCGVLEQRSFELSCILEDCRQRAYLEWMRHYGLSADGDCLWLRRTRRELIRMTVGSAASD